MAIQLHISSALIGVEWCGLLSSLFPFYCRRASSRYPLSRRPGGSRYQFTRLRSVSNVFYQESNHISSGAPPLAVTDVNQRPTVYILKGFPPAVAKHLAIPLFRVNLHVVFFKSALLLYDADLTLHI
jgi:hypothetical protein